MVVPQEAVVVGGLIMPPRSVLATTAPLGEAYRCVLENAHLRHDIFFIDTLCTVTVNPHPTPPAHVHNAGFQRTPVCAAAS